MTVYVALLMLAIYIVSTLWIRRAARKEPK